MNAIDLSDQTPMQLLQMFAAVIDELKRRGLVRTINNPVADYTEWLVMSKLKLNLLGNSVSGCDATGCDGKKYQIKGRRVSAAHAVSGRSVAGEDALVPGAAVLRKRIPVRPASVDLRGRHRLGVTRHRADST